MKIGRAATTLLALFALAGCGDSTGPQDSSLVVNILDTRTEAPAKVLVTFQLTTQDGTPVPNVPVTSFEILDNGQPDSQLEASKAFEPRPGRFQAHVALVLDMSGSITGSNALPALKTASKAFVERALDATGVSVGIWWFDGGADLVQLMGFSTNETALKAAIDGLSEETTRDNSTNLNGAIQQGIQIVEQRIQDGAVSGIAQAGALVIFTDGTDQANRVPASTALAAVQSTGIAVYAIALRGEIDEAFLGRIGRSGSAFADNAAGLLTRFSAIGGDIEALANSYYVLAYCSPRRSGVQNNLTIRVRHDGRQGDGETTYAAVNFTGGCTL